MNALQQLSTGELAYFLDNAHVQTLESSMQRAEQLDEPRFTYFSDYEVVYYWIHDGRNLSAEKNRKANTREVYTKEILMFVTQLVEQADTFGLDGEEIQRTGSILKSLRPFHLRNYGRWLKEAPLGRGGAPYSAATLQKKTTIIRSFLQYIYKHQYIVRSIHESLLRESVHESDRPNRDLDRAEVEAILHYFKEQHDLTAYTVTLLLATTGLRIRELTSACMRDIFRANGKLWLKVWGKRGTVRDVYMSETVMEALTAFRARRGFSTALFPETDSPLLMTTRGNAYNPNQLSNQVTQWTNSIPFHWIQQRDNPITPHTFRHAFAIMAHEAGSDVYHIQKTLGHQSINTTAKIYLAQHQKRKHNAALGFADDLN
ncbi:MAG: tyrosine-type recombinase/integrase [Bacilli bacterium]